MKNLIVSGIAMVVIVAIVLGLFALCGWTLSVLLNVIFSQIGLGTMNFWGGCCLLASATIMKNWMCWGSD